MNWVEINVIFLVIGLHSVEISYGGELSDILERSRLSAFLEEDCGTVKDDLVIRYDL